MDVNEFQVVSGKGFSLPCMKTVGSGNGGKEKAAELLKNAISSLAELQERLYAESRQGLVIIFQGMDAAGKDGLIKHVMSGINPAGCSISSFKTPSEVELGYDYLRRCAMELPARGRIGIFNRSYYEEVLVVRVHKVILERQHLPERSRTKGIWKDRFRDICNFEQYLHGNGFRVVKFFLHVSREEQARRLLERLRDNQKLWKFSPQDVAEGEYWNEYMQVYEEMIAATSTPFAPWVVVPADNKWFARTVVSETLVRTLTEMDPRYPKATMDEHMRLEAIAKLENRLQGK